MACPWLACQTCDNRVIIPQSYRTSPNDLFTCFSCQAGKKPSVDEETNLRTLMEENGREWIGFDHKLDLFHNQSAFKLFSKYGADAFTGVPVDQTLTLHHKKIFNSDIIRLKIEGRVATGEVEKGESIKLAQ